MKYFQPILVVLCLTIVHIEGYVNMPQKNSRKLQTDTNTGTDLNTSTMTGGSTITDSTNQDNTSLSTDGGGPVNQIPSGVTNPKGNGGMNGQYNHQNGRNCNSGGQSNGRKYSPNSGVQPDGPNDNPIRNLQDNLNRESNGCTDKPFGKPGPSIDMASSPQNLRRILQNSQNIKKKHNLPNKQPGGCDDQSRMDDDNNIESAEVSN